MQRKPVTKKIIPRIAIYFPHLTRPGKPHVGGAEFRMLQAMEVLQNQCDITLVTGARPDWKTLKLFYGTSLTEESLELLLLRRRAGFLDERVFFLPYCGRHFDLCICGHNVQDFRVPAVHFVANCRFERKLAESVGASTDDVEGLIPRIGSDGMWGMAQRMKRAVKYAVSWIYGGRPRSVEEVIRSPHERIVCNSHWIAAKIADCYGIARPEVLYPPVVAKFPDVPWSSRDNSFVCIGRVDPEKRLEQVIEIMDRVRDAGFPKLRLHLAGRIRETSYGRKIRGLIRTRQWITAYADVYGDAKRTLISSRRFALHACEIEGFGISVAEYVKAGVIPFVPGKGGAAEVVPFADLQYRTTKEAVQKIVGRSRYAASKNTLYRSKYCNL
jgi:glycosyltransferase involved in cell wall biosynthesis